MLASRGTFDLRFATIVFMRGRRSERLIGREQELSLLEYVVSEARAGDPRVVLIEGEPGIGKTRLAIEVINGLRSVGDLVVSGHGIDLGGGELAFGVAAELLRDVVRQVGIARVRAAVGGNADPLMPLLPTLPGQRARAKAVIDRAALFAAMHGLVVDLAAESLLCIFVDDLQWVDASSLDLLTFLATVSSDARLLILFTVRSIPAETDRIAVPLGALSRVMGSQTIALVGLLADEVAAKVAESLGAEAHPEFVERVQRLSDGVPLYVEELVAASGGAATTTLRVNMAGRLSGLSEEALRFLQVVAVGEGHAHLGSVATLSRLERRRAALAHRAAIGRGLLSSESGPMVRFHHALLRDAVLDTLLPGELEELHRAWAEQLEVDPVAVSAHDRAMVVAGHWSGSGDHQRALVAAIAAARSSVAQSAAAEAAYWWGRALRLWNHVDQAETLTGLGRDEVLIETLRRNAWIDASGWEELKRLCSAELATVGPENSTKRLVLRLGHARAEEVLTGTLHPVLKAHALSETLDAVLHDPTTSYAFMCLDLITYHLRDQLDDASSDRLADALLYVARRSGDRDALVLAWRDRAAIALARGDTAMAISDARQTVDLTRDGLRLRAVDLGSLIWTFLSVGEFDEAVAIADSLADLRPDLAAVTLWAYPAENVVWALYALGDWERCWDLASVLTQVQTSPTAAGTTRALMAQIAAQRGELDMARDHLDVARELLPAVGTAGSSVGITAPAAIAAAVVAQREGAHQKALTAVLPVLRAADLDKNSDVTYAAILVAADCLAHTADSEQATTVVRAAGERVHRLGRLGAAWSAEVGASLDRAAGIDTVDQWRLVVKLWEDIAFAVHATRSRLNLAESLLRSGARDDAAGVITEGLERAGKLGARPLEEDFRRLARAGRIPVKDEALASTLSRITPLTARENEVVGLLALGRTNAQIAAELFMSPKTASVHVSRIITKLGVSNRTEVAAFAHRHGIVER